MTTQRQSHLRRQRRTRSPIKQRRRIPLVLASVFCFLSCSLLPILYMDRHASTDKPLRVPMSVHNLIEKTEEVVARKWDQHERKVKNKEMHKRVHSKTIPTSLDEIDTWDGADYAETHSIARGVSGVEGALPNAHRAHIECDQQVDSLAYWNIDESASMESPFAIHGTKEKFITFSPDRGGWNNVRMSMEIIFVLAAVTGRTLVLPPKEPLYLLHHDKGERFRGFGDFFPLESQTKVKVISMEEFTKNRSIPQANKTIIVNGAQHCEKRKKSSHYCGPLMDWLKKEGFNTELSASKSCVIFDTDSFHGRSLSDESHNYVESRCGKRQVVYWKEEWSQPDVLHFRANEKEYRLLTHFYNMLHFTDPKIGNYYKRLVRDHLHYHDQIWCAAGKIVKALQQEASTYSALHVRRGDLQYKKVKIPAQEWYDNTRELYEPHEVLYVATDERNKTFFDDLAKHHELRYLDDYWELAGLADLDPNYMGMIDSIVASHGRVFVGTWFSTFSGYINRLRGYQGRSMMDSWYSFLPRKTAVHEWKTVDTVVYAYEYPDGWIGIDGDERPAKKIF